MPPVKPSLVLAAVRTLAPNVPVQYPLSLPSGVWLNHINFLFAGDVPRATLYATASLRARPPGANAVFRTVMQMFRGYIWTDANIDLGSRSSSPQVWLDEALEWQIEFHFWPSDGYTAVNCFPVVLTSGIKSGDTVIVDEEPGSGPGFLRWVTVFHDRAGDAAAVDFNLFSAGHALRKIYGVAWYYHCSGDVATRTFNSPRLNSLGGTKPTGFTLTGGNARFWIFGGTGAITLTVDEEGAFISYATDGKDGRSVRNDVDSQSVDSTATEPAPWPLWVTESDTDTILRFPAITTGNANDRHSAYVLTEEWAFPEAR